MHYLREHAPNGRYLPNDINIADIWREFNKNQSKNMSYESMRLAIKDMNIWISDSQSFLVKDVNYVQVTITIWKKTAVRTSAKPVWNSLSTKKDTLQASRNEHEKSKSIHEKGYMWKPVQT